jgi:solute carrier family 25 folate transporter 32
MPLDAHLVAGILSGVISSFLLHPLDVLKVRFQVQDGVVNALRYRSVLGAVRDVHAAEGVRGFYRGVSPALLGSGLSWGLYFYFYEACKRRLREGGGGGGAPLTSVQLAYAAWEGGTITCLCTNPVWLVKTRMQLQTGGSGGYASMAHAFSSIVREEGPQGLYRGLAPALLLTLHGVVQFVTYEALKVRLASDSDAALLCAGVLSKVAAVTLTYPYQVTKSRLQQRFAGAPEYTGLLDCLAKTWRRERFQGFYRGFVTNLLRVAPSSALTLLLYERVRAHLEAAGK